jgi:hypothetical protein
MIAEPMMPPRKLPAPLAPVIKELIALMADAC